MSRSILSNLVQGKLGAFWLPLVLLLIPGACQGSEETAEPCPSDIQANPLSTRVLGEPVVVPPGRTPTIDGTIAAEEWECATIESFADGSLLYLMHDDEYLYLAIRSDGPDMIVTNVHLELDDEIAVLHASAALGTAIYQAGEHGWEQIANYDWCCRGRVNDTAAEEARQDFLASDGWLATNSRLGQPNEMEYQIALPAGEARLAVVFLRLTQPDVRVPWPVGLHDDCIEPQASGFEDHSHFSPETWVTIELQ